VIHLQSNLICINWTEYRKASFVIHTLDFNPEDLESSSVVGSRYEN
jgi:hypothetical protein